MSERIVSDPSQHGWVEVDGKWVWDASGGGAGGGAGAGMVISETEPTDKMEGMQWLNPTTGLVLFWDAEKWLQMPTTGAAGKDGKDGVDGPWTDNGDTSISYMDGSVGIGTIPGETSGLNIDSDSNVTWNESSGGSFANVFRQASSGALVLAQGYKQTATPNGFASSKSGNFPKSAITVANGIRFYVNDYTDAALGSDVTPTQQMSIDYNGRVDITGSLYVNGTPKIGTDDLIKAFSRLRDAVKDEENVESLKESIANCIGGLIEEWESMQSPATQEISDE